MYTKYPSTHHFPWSNSTREDSIWSGGFDHYEGIEIVVTEKMDGENTTLYRDYLHARSLEILRGELRSFMLSKWAEVRNQIPEGLRICGENLEAKHSIHYKDLEAFFQVFSMWRGTTCLSWDETFEQACTLGFATVPILYRGEWDEKRIRAIQDQIDLEHHEGYVVRPVRSFEHEEFTPMVLKYVRPGHVQTDQHWTRQPKTLNELRRPDGTTNNL